MSGALDRSLPTFARVFAAAGYETAASANGTLAVHRATTDSTCTTRDGRCGARAAVVAFLGKRTTGSSARPLLLIVSWLNPHDIYDVLAQTPSARALAAARLPANLTDDLGTKPLPQRHFLDQDQGRPFVGATPEVWRRYRAFYNELVETVDREIGTVLGALPRCDVAPITIFSRSRRLRRRARIAAKGTCNV